MLVALIPLVSGCGGVTFGPAGGGLAVGQPIAAGCPCGPLPLTGMAATGSSPSLHCTWSDYPGLILSRRCLQRLTAPLSLSCSSCPAGLAARPSGDVLPGPPLSPFGKRSCWPAFHRTHSVVGLSASGGPRSEAGNLCTGAWCALKSLAEALDERDRGGRLRSSAGRAAPFDGGLLQGLVPPAAGHIGRLAAERGHPWALLRHVLLKYAFLVTLCSGAALFCSDGVRNSGHRGRGPTKVRTMTLPAARFAVGASGGRGMGVRVGYSSAPPRWRPS